MKLWKVAAVAGAAVLVAAFFSTPFADNAGKKEELTCPRAYENHTHYLLTGESSVDQLVQTHGKEKASLVVYPNATQHGSLRVCGEQAMLMLLSEATGPVLVAGNSARVIREVSVPEPADFRLEGDGAKKVLCTRDGVTQNGLPSCRSLLSDPRGLKWTA